MEKISQSPSSQRWLGRVMGAMSRRRVILILFLLAVPPLLLAALGVSLHYWGKQDRTQRADAIIVFGAYVNKRNQASPSLYARNRHAFDLWKRGLAPIIVCTGGVGTFPPAEALVSKQLLEGWGVPSKAILFEDKSTSTWENARYAAELLPRGATVIGVSEPFHLWRCRRSGAAFGLTLYPSPSLSGWNHKSPYDKVVLCLREAVLVTRDVLSSPFS